jgi:hypothetical protein
MVGGSGGGMRFFGKEGAEVSAPDRRGEGEKSVGLPGAHFFDTEALTQRSRNQSNGVETQSAQRFRSRSQRNASASVASFGLRAICDEKSGLENKAEIGREIFNRESARRSANCGLAETSAISGFPYGRWKMYAGKQQA